MKMIKFLRILLNESGMDGMYRFAPGERHVELVAAQSQIANLIAAYDALAPDWSQAPDWAKWYAIDADGNGRFREREPEIMKEESRWYGIALEGHIDNVLPIGIDWRLCKWQRPEVTP